MVDISWDLLGWIIAFFVPLGVGVIALNEFRLAKSCFVVSAVVLFAKVAIWLSQMHMRPYAWMLVSFLVFGTIGVCLIGSIRWVDRKKPGAAAPDLAGSASLPGPEAKLSRLPVTTKLEASEPSALTAAPSPLTKLEKFVVVVPFDTAHKNLPIPMDLNINDPKRRVYSDLMSIAGRPEKQPDGTPWPTERNFDTEAARSVFLGKLLQFYIFRSIDELQRDSEGVEWTAGKGSRPFVRVGIVPPDSAPYPSEALFATLSKSEFFGPRERMNWNPNRPVKMPKHTTIHFTEQPSSPQTGPAAYIVRLDRPQYFTIDFRVTQTLGPVTVAGVTGASIPTGFQAADSVAATTVGCPFIVTVKYEIQRSKQNAEFQPDDYMKWAESLLSALKERLAFESGGG